MSPTIISLRQFLGALFLFSALLTGNKAYAQVFDQFRLLGNHNGVTTGFVTSVGFDKAQNTATIHFLNIAGSSDELTVTLTPSASIPGSLPVFLPPVTFIQPEAPYLDLVGVEFFEGTISSDVSDAVPPHWFRLTYFDNRWSGVFRVDNRIYSIDRYSDDTTIGVRPANHGDLDFLPNTRIKASAVVDEHFVMADAVGDQTGMDNLGHLYALESVHVLDGLLADSFGITLMLEQLIYQSAAALSTADSAGNFLDDAEQWSNVNADVFGLTDNLATLFFRGELIPDNADESNAQTNDHIAVLGKTADYQFATAHSFGRLLGLPFESQTIQHWHAGTPDPLPYVLWSDDHQQFIDNQSFPDMLIQTISNDTPELADPTQEETSEEIDEGLIIAEGPESGGLINNDDDSAALENSSAGGGTVGLTLLGLIVLFHRRRYAHT